MKYMGSKRAMLLNGLGALIEDQISGSKRFVDLFSGSAAVACHVAQKFDVPVLATDLQSYSVVLASAVLIRRRTLDHKRIWRGWHRRARVAVDAVGPTPRVPHALTKKVVARHRRWCAGRVESALTTAYGGHYFSARQMVWIVALRKTLPKGSAVRRAALAALIQAASQCIASPGHTAQPFQPTRSAKKFLLEAWSKDIVQATKRNLEEIAKVASRKKGAAQKLDANATARKLKDTDLVFVDPPYSGVHYSRFYHVLESIAVDRCGEVSGIGRYPARRLRPRSKYSIQTEAKEALDDLLSVIAKRQSKAILTFPNHRCSNGLSGYWVQKIAARHFDVQKRTVGSRFSTLGGNGSSKKGGRKARRDARELVLTLIPRGASIVSPIKRRRG